MAVPVVRAVAAEPSRTAKTLGPRAKALKRLEAARIARVKRASQAFVRTLKQADVAAREMFVQDLQDVTEAATEALLRPPPADEDAAQ